MADYAYALRIERLAGALPIRIVESSLAILPVLVLENETALPQAGRGWGSFIIINFALAS